MRVRNTLKTVQSGQAGEKWNSSHIKRKKPRSRSIVTIMICICVIALLVWFYAFTKIHASVSSNKTAALNNKESVGFITKDDAKKKRAQQIRQHNKQKKNHPAPKKDKKSPQRNDKKDEKKETKKINTGLRKEKKNKKDDAQPKKKNEDPKDKEITLEEATIACAKAKNESKGFCIQDVMATGDLEMAEDPFYTES